MYKTGNYLIYKEHMNLRNAPTANSHVLSVIPRGSCIQVSEVKDNWGRTEFNGFTGWCCISECFAQLVCDCEKNECCYFQKYTLLEEEYRHIKENMDKIKAILK